jgi:hypothetical protein
MGVMTLASSTTAEDDDSNRTDVRDPDANDAEVVKSGPKRLRPIEAFRVNRVPSDWLREDSMLAA